MVKKGKGILLLVGIAATGAAIWYFTKPETPPVVTPPPPPPPPTPPAGSTPTYVPNTTPDNSSAPGLFPVITGTQAKIGDKLWSSETAPITIYKNVNPGESSGWTIHNNDYAGQVVDISPYGMMKVVMYEGAPVWNNAIQTAFYLPKNKKYTVRS